MARPTMRSLIDRIRVLIGDKDTIPHFTDDDIQEALDTTQRQYTYARLIHIPTRAPGTGLTTFLTYRSPVGGNWEGGEQLFDSSYMLLAPTSADYLNGAWTFALHVPPPVYISGNTYDVNRTAATLFQAWAYELGAGDRRFTQLMERAESLLRQSKPRIIPSGRPDFEEGYE